MNTVDIPDDRKQLFKTLTDILAHFIEFCETYGLTYFVIAGTLLGTIRHKGIIPWDDDIDVLMMRDDYDKMLEIIRKGNNNTQYQFVNPETDPYFPKAFTRFSNNCTTMIPLKDAMYKYNHGCFIDIFPVDRIPDNKQKRFSFFLRCRLYLFIQLALGRYKSNIGTLGLSLKKRVLYYLAYPLFATNIITPAKLFKEYNKFASQYRESTEDAREIGTVTVSGENPRCIYLPEYFEETLQMPFENITVNVPKGWDLILRHAYGDYMTPVMQASVHGDSVFDPNIGYKEYIEKNKDFLEKEFVRIKTKKID